MNLIGVVGVPPFREDRGVVDVCGAAEGDGEGAARGEGVIGGDSFDSWHVDVVAARNVLAPLERADPLEKLGEG